MMHSQQNQQLAPQRANLLLGKNVVTTLVRSPDPGQRGGTSRPTAAVGRITDLQPSPSRVDWIRAAKQNTLNPDLAVFEGVTVHLLFRTQRLYFCLHLMSSKLAAKSNGDGPADRFLVKQLCWQCRLMFQDN